MGAKVQITITAEAEAMMRKCATPGTEYHDTSIRHENGWITIPLDPAVADRLEASRLGGESLSDAIIRIASFYLSKGRLN